jgi:predicted permease
MRHLERLLNRLRNSALRRRDDKRLQEEIEEHLALQTADNVRAGFPPSEARRQALLKFGAVEAIREEYWAEGGLAFLETLLQDVRFGWRSLRKSPGFTAVAVLTLALGIGANTAIFSVVNSVLIRNLPVRDPQQLVFLTNPDAQGMEQGFGDGDRDFLTYPEFQELSHNNQVLSGLAASASEGPQLSVEIDGQSGEGTPARISLVSGSYFSVLGVDPILGRAFTSDVDMVRDASPMAVISYSFWHGRFAGDSAVLGRKIRIRDTSYDVIGVTPSQFNGETVGLSPDIWVPLSMQSEVYPGRDYLSLEPKPFRKIEWLHAIGRLKAGVSVAQAKVSINVAFQQILQSQTAPMSGEERRMFLNQHLAVVEGGRGASTLRGDFSKALQILMALVGLILLIACANVANILLARSAARQRELAVRVAMGAGASRLFRQVLTESVLLATIGAAFSLLLAHWADAALLRLVAGGPNPVPLDVHLDSRILAFTLGVAVLSGILFGLTPALRAARIDLSSVLKGTSRSIASSGSQAGRVPVGKILVVAQVALSLLLLVVAGLFLRSFQNLAAVQIGYDSDHLLLFGVSPLSSGFKGPRAAQLLKDIIERLDAVPGVRSASLMDNGLFGGGDSNSDIFVEGAKPKAVETPASRWDMVGPNFFSTTGIPILYGREIGPQDSGNSQRVGLLNQTAAHYYFGDANPVGSRIRVKTTVGPSDFVVIGVVADSKHGSVREKPQRRFYIPFFNPIGDASSANVLVRTSGDPATIVSAVRAAVKQMAANLPLIEVQTMNQRVSQSLATDRTMTKLSGVFGPLAMVLVCIGLYGIMSYAVSGRTSEFGIRIALGAQRGSVLWLILRESLLLMLVGVAIGLPLIFGAGKWISSLLFGVKPADPTALALATALMFATGILACYIPARRAMRVNPIVALRYE